MRHENSKRRRASFREPVPRVLIVCGGERTERAYFEGFKQSHRRAAVAIDVCAKVRSPAQLVHHAAKIWQRDHGKYDEVWCVVDTDQFDISAARKAAEGVAIDLAVSNPCFEYWLLLHFTSHAAALAVKDALTCLRQHVPGYEKSKVRFEVYAPGVDGAVARAKAIDPTGLDHALNPSTGVWRLVERIIGS